MKLSIGFSWPAWSGVNTAGLLLWELLSSKWYTVHADKEYASIIKGDNNNFFLYISDDTIPYIAKKIDHFIAFDEYAIEKNKEIYTLKKTHNLSKCTCKYKNIPAFWVVLKLLNIPYEEGIQAIEKIFTGEILEMNKAGLKEGYDFIKKSVIDASQSIWSKKIFMFGNEVVGKWAMSSWLEYYAAYPMTPASTLIEIITQDPKVTFFQWEDEIAVSMSMLWAHFAGKRAMCWTSWWWFALMTESISFANQTEIGWVYVLSQRDGPSTGTPTYTGQWDIDFALNASFWDTKPIVVAPSTFEDGYTLIGKALNWADMYQHPVIVLLDKQFSESYISIDAKVLKAESIKKGKLENIGSQWYKRYAIIDDGISPYTILWTENGEFIASSYEHDEYGATNELPIIKQQQEEKRMKKLETFVTEELKDNFYGYEIINPDAKYFFVTFWYNRYVLESVIKEKNKKGNTYWCIIIKLLQPFDKRLKKWLEEHSKQIKKLTFVEMNYSGQLEELVRNTCILHWTKREKKIDHKRKYILYPFFEEDFK